MVPSISCIIKFHVLPLCNRSKSLSDIPMVYPVRKDTGTASEWNQENRRISVAAKDNEAKWQDVS